MAGNRAKVGNTVISGSNSARTRKVIENKRKLQSVRSLSVCTQGKVSKIQANIVRSLGW